MATQRVTVLIRSIRRSDFIQNERTKSQSPAEPIAEPVIITKSTRRETGSHTEPHHPIVGVKALQRMVRTIKPNALRLDIAVRSLRETTIANA
jgi:hypothetical protein